MRQNFIELFEICYIFYTLIDANSGHFERHILSVAADLLITAAPAFTTVPYRTEVVLKQDPNAENSRVDILSAKVSSCQRRFRTLPVIGAADGCV